MSYILSQESYQLSVTSLAGMGKIC